MLGAREEGFAVWPENMPAVQTFLCVQTQWSHSGMGGPAGLDYARVKVALSLAGEEVTPELFRKLQLMEAGALEELARIQKRRSNGPRGHPDR